MVSSRTGARMAVVVKRERNVGRSRVSSWETASTVPRELRSSSPVDAATRAEM